MPGTPFNPVVVAPTFNNVRTLARVLREIDTLGIAVIVLDDGSFDGTAAILAKWQQENPKHCVVTHPQNRGKAAALLTAFEKARELGFTHGITIDTDGQLDPAEIPRMLEAARKSPRAMVVGCRDETRPDYPKKSRLGRRVSNLLVRWESGAVVSDSQCGFRVYPLRELAEIKCSAGRYGFETEVLSRAAWAGVGIEQVVVTCTYEVPEGRVSHFRPWRDSLSAVRMHARLMARSAWVWPVRRFEGTTENETGTMWRRFGRWVSPARAWRAVRDDPAERSRFAAALAVGVFIANLPLYGLQTLLSLLAAKRLKLNPLTVVVGSHFSTPPIGPVLIAAAIMLGHLIIHGRLPALRSFDPAIVGYGTLIKSVVVEWTVGGVVIGTALALLTFFAARIALRAMPMVDRRGDSETHPGELAQGRDRAGVESAV